VDRTNGNAAILLTPRAGGQGAAIAVVRICGGGVGGFLGRFFSKGISPGKCIHGELCDGKLVIDDVVVVAGTDWADICVHGGAWVVESVLNLARQEGFDVLESTLPVADAAMDGASELEREVASWLPLARTRQALRMLLDQPLVWQQAKETGFDAAAVLADRTLWRLLHPPEIAIVGEPNVGKSTLANRMFGQQRSITADVPGTTRDWVGEMADIGGMPAVLIDTPGLRQTEDEIEREAISASVERTQGCELVIEVLDATRDPGALTPSPCTQGEGGGEGSSRSSAHSPSPGTPAFGSEAQARRGEGWGGGLSDGSSSLGSPHGFGGDRRILVVNKVDAVAGWDSSSVNSICISAKTGRGIDELCAVIHRRLGVEGIGERRMRWWTERQREELSRASL
jgi:tRNA U34 5-carboxymethylaminomethyl modifying GTPase MnmE/TrmE